MRIELSTGTPAEVAEPQGEPRAGLVLFPDIGGLRPLFDDICARLANDWGVVVCAPEPFPGREGMALEERFEAMRELRDDDKLADARAAAERTGAETCFVTGFCMGGMYALKAASLDLFDRCVSFYGMIKVPDAWADGGQGEPLGFLRERGASHCLALIGTEDPWVSVEDGEELKELGAEVVVYEGADHGFVHDPERPAHRPDDAADAWRRAREWFGV